MRGWKRTALSRSVNQAIVAVQLPDCRVDLQSAIYNELCAIRKPWPNTSSAASH